MFMTRTMLNHNKSHCHGGKKYLYQMTKIIPFPNSNPFPSLSHFGEKQNKVWKNIKKINLSHFTKSKPQHIGINRFSTRKTMFTLFMNFKPKALNFGQIIMISSSCFTKFKPFLKFSLFYYKSYI